MELDPCTDRRRDAVYKRQDRIFFCTANQSELEAILVAYMLPVSVFIGLLLWLLLIRADEQVVIKDSEAIGNSDENSQTRRSPGSFRLMRVLQLTLSQNRKGRTFASRHKNPEKDVVFFLTCIFFCG